MKLSIEIAYAIVLLTSGYIAAILYLSKENFHNVHIQTFALNSRNRILYLTTAVVINVALIVSFTHYFEDKSLVHQMQLLTLINFLVPISAIDYRIYKIPNSFLLGALAVRAVFYIIDFARSIPIAWQNMKESLLAAAILMVFFTILLLIFKNGIGMGDIKLIGIMGLYQGLWGSVNAVFYSLVAAFFVALTLLITKRKNRKDMIPFGPCIMVGTALSMILTGI